ncbi:unnamed protein product [Dibothriocephalus latus]|uniref:Trematode PH-like domain-containing protein n=1 Tax=Dibothriocephalus latus TaxID=60516 RepID=A0A3P7N5I5_DIBLA|nr:unnamed protein product [Dibothriocephalus latus]
MPSYTIQDKKNDKKKEKNTLGHAILRGYVPIPNGQEVTIEAAIEAIEAPSKKSIEIPYKCKVFDSVTYLVVRRKDVVDTAIPWKLRIPYLEIYRYLIFARDPCLVVLVIPEKASENWAYLILSMETPAQASAICDAIQKRRQDKFGDRNAADKGITPQIDEATCVDSILNSSSELRRARNNNALQREAPSPTIVQQTWVEAQ